MNGAHTVPIPSAVTGYVIHPPYAAQSEPHGRTVTSHAPNLRPVKAHRMYVAHDVARSRSVFDAPAQSEQHVVSIVHPHGAVEPVGSGAGAGTGLMTGIGPSLYETLNLPARTNVACAGSDKFVADFVTTMYPIRVPMP